MRLCERRGEQRAAQLQQHPLGVESHVAQDVAAARLLAAGPHLQPLVRRAPIKTSTSARVSFAPTTASSATMSVSVEMGIANEVRVRPQQDVAIVGMLAAVPDLQHDVLGERRNALDGGDVIDQLQDRR